MRGTEIPNHRAKMATRVPKGMAAEEPSTHRIRFIRKKSAKMILGHVGETRAEGWSRRGKSHSSKQKSRLLTP